MSLLSYTVITVRRTLRHATKNTNRVRRHLYHRARYTSAGRAMLAPRMLLRLPFYIAWKLALYARLVRKKEEQAWVRTERVD